jgi:hypothetical protein
MELLNYSLNCEKHKMYLLGMTVEKHSDSLILRVDCAYLGVHDELFFQNSTTALANIETAVRHMTPAMRSYWTRVEPQISQTFIQATQTLERWENTSPRLIIVYILEVGKKIPKPYDSNIVKRFPSTSSHPYTVNQTNYHPQKTTTSKNSVIKRIYQHLEKVSTKRINQKSTCIDVRDNASGGGTSVRRKSS